MKPKDEEIRKSPSSSISSMRMSHSIQFRETSWRIEGREGEN